MATTRPRRPAAPIARAPHRDPDPSAGDGNGADATAPDSVAAPPDVDAILRRAVEEAARLLRSDGAMTYLLDPETGVLRFAHDAGITDDRRRTWVRSLKLEIGVGMFGRAVAAGEVVTTGDYPNDPSFVHFPDADRLVDDMAIHSFVVAPLVSGDGPGRAAKASLSSR